MEHRRDWDAQCERLSAYLDRHLTDGERADLERHVSGCARCTAELAALRQVVSLLGALPVPQAPRSFALPDSVATQPRAHPGAVGVRGRAPSAVAAQWAGGVAAAAGLVVLLGGLLALHGPMLVPTAASSLSRAATTSRAPSASAQHDQHATPSPGRGTFAGQSPTGTPATVNGAASTPQQTPAGATPVAPSTEQHASDTASATAPPGLPEVPIAGATLLIGGATAFALGRRAARRRT
jgi:Putative zinc-finger